MNDMDIFTDDMLVDFTSNMRRSLAEYLDMPLERLQKRLGGNMKICSPFASMSTALPLLFRFETELVSRGFDTHDESIFGPDVSMWINEALTE